MGSQDCQTKTIIYLFVFYLVYFFLGGGGQHNNKKIIKPKLLEVPLFLRVWYKYLAVAF